MVSELIAGCLSGEVHEMQLLFLNAHCGWGWSCLLRGTPRPRPGSLNHQRSGKVLSQDPRSTQVRHSLSAAWETQQKGRQRMPQMPLGGGLATVLMAVPESHGAGTSSSPLKERPMGAKWSLCIEKAAGVLSSSAWSGHPEGRSPVPAPVDSFLT